VKNGNGRSRKRRRGIRRGRKVMEKLKKNHPSLGCAVVFV